MKKNEQERETSLQEGEEQAKRRHGKLYYALIAVCALVLAAAVVLMAVFLTPRQNEVLEEPGKTEQPEDPDGGKDDEKDPSDDDDPGQNTDTEVVFALPVANATVTETFSFWYNSTLNRYCLHTGVDFSAEAGTEVTAAYAGTVESVTEDILEGGKVVLSHGDGLYTVYASIDAAAGLRVGDSVTRGEVIGTVSAAADAMGNEYNEGAHLHFEVLEGEKQIDPATYLDYEEK